MGDELAQRCPTDDERNSTQGSAAAASRAPRGRFDAQPGAVDQLQIVDATGINIGPVLLRQIRGVLGDLLDIPS
jgi:hypothetical protein